MTIRAITFRQLILVVISAAACAFLVACASSSSGGSSSTTPTITVTISTPPPATMTTGSIVPLAAQITGDTTNSGVVWSCSLGNSATNCGQFSSSDSLQTTYTAPTVTGNVTITVASVHQSSAAATAQIAIAPGLLGDGNYVFSLSGTDMANSALSPYFVTGAFTVLNGSIAAGEQDSDDAASFGVADQINPIGSSLSQTADGNLQIILAISCPGPHCPGVKGVETLNASFLPQNPQKANLIEFDASASASGILEFQDSTAVSTAPVGGYAFAVSGQDKNGNPTSIGGVIDIPVAGQVSQANSVFDINDGGAVQVSQAFTLASTATVTPDGFGRVEFELYPASSTPLQFNLIGYVVDGNRMPLIETFDPFQGTLGGVALSQTNPESFSATSIAGSSFVLGLTGSHLTNGTATPLQIAALLTFNSDTSISGSVSSSGVPQSPFSITAAAAPNYMVGSTGRVAVSGLTVGPNSFTPALYLVGNGRAMAITVDTLNVASGHVLEGAGFEQTAITFNTESFNGKYGIETTGWDAKTTGEIDAVGGITATGSSGTFSGTVDLNWLNSSTPTRPGLAISGDLTATTNTSIFTGTITGLDVTTPTNSDILFNFYLIDLGDAIAIETDGNQLTMVFLNQQ
jgi:hypothetical protein